MPFNQLLLPLLGGYVFINHTYLPCYWASRHSKEHLIFLSAVAGAFLLVVSRTFAYLICLSPIGQLCAKAIHVIAPYPGIGTATGAFFLGLAFRFWFNRTWTRERAPLWHYAKGSFSELEELLFKCSIPTEPSPFLKRHPFQSLLLGLFGWEKVAEFFHGAARRLRWDYSAPPQPPSEAEQPGAPLPVMLFMKNRKVYVGYVRFALPVRAESKPFIKIVPAWSGYRDKDTLIVEPTADYDGVINFLTESSDATVDMFEKVICIDDIETANLYDPKSFELFNGLEDEEPYEDMDIDFDKTG